MPTVGYKQMLLPLLLSWLALLCVGIEFSIDLPPTSLKCYNEEVTANTLVITDGKPEDQKSKIDFVVAVLLSGKRTELVRESETSAMKAAFTMVEDGTVQLCVHNKEVGVPVRVKIVMKSGALAKDYSVLAKAEHLEPLAVDIRRVSDRMFSYHRKLVVLRARESRTRATTESTSRRVVWFSVGSIVLLISVTVFQDLYFRRFLRVKKII